MFTTISTTLYHAKAYGVVFPFVSQMGLKVEASTTASMLPAAG